MRTTVRLESDVAAAVERVRKESGVGLSQAVNQLARAGMAQRPTAAPFRQRTARIGLRLDVTDVADTLEVLEGPSAR